MKPKAMNEKQFLDLLKKVLPKTTSDINLAGKIIDAIEKELGSKVKKEAFEKFCEKCELPDLEPTTVMEVKEQLKNAFGEGNVSVKVNKKDEALDIELKMGGAELASQIKVKPVSGDEVDPELVLKFVPFPVCLPADPELVWMLGKRENLTSEEAGIFLAKVEEDFWASKSGQKLIRDRVERSFPEFIARVPSKMLTEVGLKRHYKEPEPIKAMQSLAQPDKKTSRMGTATAT